MDRPPARIRKTRATHPCPQCGKTFTKRSNMLIHARLHTGETPYVCKYAGCGRSYKWLSSINFHEGRCEKRSAGLAVPAPRPPPPPAATEAARVAAARAAAAASAASLAGLGPPLPISDPAADTAVAASYALQPGPPPDVSVAQHSLPPPPHSQPSHHMQQQPLQQHHQPPPQQQHIPQSSAHMSASPMYPPLQLPSYQSLQLSAQRRAGSVQASNRPPPLLHPPTQHVHAQQPQAQQHQQHSSQHQEQQTAQQHNQSYHHQQQQPTQMSQYATQSQQHMPLPGQQQYMSQQMLHHHEGQQRASAATQQRMQQPQDISFSSTQGLYQRPSHLSHLEGSATSPMGLQSRPTAHAEGGPAGTSQVQMPHPYDNQSLPPPSQDDESVQQRQQREAQHEARQQRLQQQQFYQQQVMQLSASSSSLPSGGVVYTTMSLPPSTGGTYHHTGATDSAAPAPSASGAAGAGAAGRYSTSSSDAAPSGAPPPPNSNTSAYANRPIGATLTRSVARPPPLPAPRKPDSVATLSAPTTAPMSPVTPHALAAGPTLLAYPTAVHGVHSPPIRPKSAFPDNAAIALPRSHTLPPYDGTHRRPAWLPSCGKKEHFLVSKQESELAVVASRPLSMPRLSRLPTSATAPPVGSGRVIAGGTTGTPRSPQSATSHEMQQMLAPRVHNVPASSLQHHQLSQPHRNGLNSGRDLISLPPPSAQAPSVVSSGTTMLNNTEDAVSRDNMTRARDPLSGNASFHPVPHYNNHHNIDLQHNSNNNDSHQQHNGAAAVGTNGDVVGLNMGFQSEEFLVGQCGSFGGAGLLDEIGGESYSGGLQLEQGNADSDGMAIFH